MNERDAFLRGIAANIYDDTPRLAFADWLDEHGDDPGPDGRAGTPGAGSVSNVDRAEFIRVQCELEPIRDQYEIPRAAELHAREEHFGSRGMHQHDAARQWLGAMPDGWDDWQKGASIEFRRGFPDLLELPAKAFLEHGPTIRALHPTVRRVVIHCLNGRGERLAACAALRGLAELELACWCSDDDMTALAASPHLAKLQVLVLWLGRRVEGTTDAKLCQLAAKAKAWPKLRELVLLDPKGESEKRIKRHVTTVNRIAKRKVGRYERGYPKLFPLASAFYYDFPVCGRLPDGRAAVAELDDPGGHRDSTPAGLLVRTFDPAGAPTGEEIRVPLPPELADVKRGDAANWDGKYTKHLTDAIGFTPGFIRVRAYALGDDFGPRRGHDDNWDMCGYPDDPENPTDRNGDPDPTGIGGTIYHYVRNVEFVVGYDAWADKTGHVHST